MSTIENPSGSDNGDGEKSQKRVFPWTGRTLTQWEESRIGVNARILFYVARASSANIQQFDLSTANEFYNRQVADNEKIPPLASWLMEKPPDTLEKGSYSNQFYQDHGSEIETIFDNSKMFQFYFVMNKILRDKERDKSVPLLNQVSQELINMGWGSSDLAIARERHAQIILLYTNAMEAEYSSMLNIDKVKLGEEREFEIPEIVAQEISTYYWEPLAIDSEVVIKMVFNYLKEAIRTPKYIKPYDASRRSTSVSDLGEEDWEEQFGSGVESAEQEAFRNFLPPSSVIEATENVLAEMSDEAAQVLNIAMEMGPNVKHADRIDRIFKRGITISIPGQTPRVLSRTEIENLLQTVEERLKERLGPGFEESLPGGSREHEFRDDIFWRDVATDSFRLFHIIKHERNFGERSIQIASLALRAAKTFDTSKAIYRYINVGLSRPVSKNQVRYALLRFINKHDRLSREVKFDQDIWRFVRAHDKEIRERFKAARKTGLAYSEYLPLFMDAASRGSTDIIGDISSNPPFNQRTLHENQSYVWHFVHQLFPDWEVFTKENVTQWNIWKRRRDVVLLQYQTYGQTLIPSDDRIVRVLLGIPPDALQESGKDVIEAIRANLTPPNSLTALSIRSMLPRIVKILFPNGEWERLTEQNITERNVWFREREEILGRLRYVGRTFSPLQALIFEELLGVAKKAKPEDSSATLTKRLITEVGKKTRRSYSLHLMNSFIIEFGLGKLYSGEELKTAGMQTLWQALNRNNELLSEQAEIDAQDLNIRRQRLEVARIAIQNAGRTKQDIIRKIRETFPNLPPNDELLYQQVKQTILSLYNYEDRKRYFIEKSNTHAVWGVLQDRSERKKLLDELERKAADTNFARIVRGDRLYTVLKSALEKGGDKQAVVVAVTQEMNSRRAPTEQISEKSINRWIREAYDHLKGREKSKYYSPKKWRRSRETEIILNRVQTNGAIDQVKLNTFLSQLENLDPRLKEIVLLYYLNHLEFNRRTGQYTLKSGMTEPNMTVVGGDIAQALHIDQSWVSRQLARIRVNYINTEFNANLEGTFR